MAPTIWIGRLEAALIVLLRVSTGRRRRLFINNLCSFTANGLNLALVLLYQLF